MEGGQPFGFARESGDDDKGAGSWLGFSSSEAEGVAEAFEDTVAGFAGGIVGEDGKRGGFAGFVERGEGDRIGGSGPIELDISALEEGDALAKLAGASGHELTDETDDAGGLIELGGAIVLAAFDAAGIHVDDAEFELEVSGQSGLYCQGVSTLILRSSGSSSWGSRSLGMRWAA